MIERLIGHAETALTRLVPPPRRPHIVEKKKEISNAIRDSPQYSALLRFCLGSIRSTDISNLWLKW